MKYSIVIPAYKEAKIIESSLQKLVEFLHTSKTYDDTEVIVVAAESDDTAKIAKNMSAKFKSLVVIEPGPKVGKGRDVKLGMLAAKGDYVLFTDADLATPVHHITTAWEALEAGSEVAIGTRDIIKIHKGHRVIMSLGANILTRFLLLPGIPDTQCGFKAFTKTARDVCFTELETTGWGFDFEVLVRARKAKLKIKQIDIKDWADPKLNEGLAGESGITATLNTLSEMYRVRKLLGKGKR
jgi:dolichyl-phosphate beta-glucosyltransferase